MTLFALPPRPLSPSALCLLFTRTPRSPDRATRRGRASWPPPSRCSSGPAPPAVTHRRRPAGGLPTRQARTRPGPATWPRSRRASGGAEERTGSRPHARFPRRGGGWRSGGGGRGPPAPPADGGGGSRARARPRWAELAATRRGSPGGQGLNARAGEAGEGPAPPALATQ